MRPWASLVGALFVAAGCKQRPAPPRDARVDAPAAHDAAAAAPQKRYGEVMQAVGRRYELAGRAIAVEQWELASYALNELDEELEALPSARQPPEVQNDLALIAGTFADTNLPALRQAVTARDVAAANAAYAAVAVACNNCHRTAGMAFLVVPTVPGEAVPRVARP